MFNKKNFWLIIALTVVLVYYGITRLFEGGEEYFLTYGIPQLIFVIYIGWRYWGNRLE